MGPEPIFINGVNKPLYISGVRILRKKTGRCPIWRLLGLMFLLLLYRLSILSTSDPRINFLVARLPRSLILLVAEEIGDVEDGRDECRDRYKKQMRLAGFFSLEFCRKTQNVNNNNYTENSTQGIGALVLISPDTLNNYIEVIQNPPRWCLFVVWSGFFVRIHPTKIPSRTSL